MNKKILFITQAALIAAVYTVLTVMAAGFDLASGMIQVRFSEALTIMPFFTPAAIPGLFIGCFAANLLGGAIIWDIIFGSLATLIGAVFSYMLRHNRWLVPIPAILANTVIIPFVIKYGYGENMPLLLIMLYIALGEIAGCYVLGELLATALMPLKNRLFKEDLK